jgi:FtsZ-binding cell division protein ZapB
VQGIYNLFIKVDKLTERNKYLEQEIRKLALKNEVYQREIEMLRDK